MGETRGSVGERGKSQGAAHARGECIRNPYTTLSVIQKMPPLDNPLLFLPLVKVFRGRQQQLELKMQKNREAQEESLREREKLIQELELEREARRQEKEQEERRRAARVQEMKAQVSAASCVHFFIFFFLIKKPSPQFTAAYLHSF